MASGAGIRFSVQTRGLAELRRAMLELGEKAAGKLYTDALKKGGWVIAREAKRRAPVLKDPHPYKIPGVMRAAITAYPIRWNVVFVRVRNRGNPQRARAEGRRANRGADSPRNPHYWWHVEFGTSRSRAQPFLRPAYEMKKFDALGTVRDELAKGLAKATLELARSMPGAA